MIYFNSHAHVERDLTSQIATWSASSISTHTLTWSVTLADFLWNADETISTHTLTWSVTVATFNYNYCLSFQLTRSRGAWRHCHSVALQVENFNSHAHVERDTAEIKLDGDNAISTHTLTWSVTSRHPWYWFLWQISTHTLTWSVTRFLWILLLFFWISTHTLTWSVTTDGQLRSFCSRFQLTRSRGAWPSQQVLDLIAQSISTHTLTWSVTSPWIYWIKRRKFQLTRSRGAWRNWSQNRGLFDAFQLTRSRGAWLQQLKPLNKILAISTHTLTWSVTFQLRLCLRHTPFQLTRSRGAWPASWMP